MSVALQKRRSKQCCIVCPCLRCHPTNALRTGYKRNPHLLSRTSNIDDASCCTWSSSGPWSLSSPSCSTSHTVPCLPSSRSPPFLSSPTWPVAAPDASRTPPFPRKYLTETGQVVLLIYSRWLVLLPVPHSPYLLRRRGKGRSDRQSQRSDGSVDD